MVLFGADGYPKITFSFEAGSEPCATCLTPEGCLAVTLKRQGCVALWSTSGEPVTEFGHTVLSGPTGIQCDRHGRFIVADEQANSVFIFSNEGQLLTKLAPPTLDTAAQGSSSPLSQIQTSSFLNSYHNSFNQPRYVCLTHTGNYVISDSANHCIKIFDQDMQLSSQFGSYGQRDGCFKFPYGVASDAEGNLYVADHFNNRVSMFSGEGEFIQHLLTLQDGIARPKSIAVCRSLLYVTHGDIRSNKVSVFALKS
ncbi:unnamed protein product [Candidula unifasciata]|uniref:NHL repeat-containing protein n=1 Tax=Candidula unifasciata TaxID=100452 RepID=A0A8S3YMS6_9EUPU|nr:unnamed protein product [Candidula unifasciata]